ncbi:MULTISPECIES: hypothetical protein [Bacillus cereus group]|uniref:Uncharacterized protein n=1 Tax=Bacillus thuringiensis serovar toumanoffi TaxID=180862 RepID=A0ABD5I8E3_BACTU|nr:hypothetical protein [Bacillus thuringiensis]MCU5282925.1 hypothetical protein [Bacillus cereus]AMR88572.1 hypothetical protein A3L20_31860 [Bacillus thuringiensis]EEM92945.1 hypothetical protein bthur0013_57070 [Bacillus thuringiensis IBL 200]MBG9638990.1 hypothetical protein [Bacillus thuringiensis]MBG9671956.1 hypothetical protein [Bacillus thuringiensis]
MDGDYLVGANTTTKDEALSYQKDLRGWNSHNKILRVPISARNYYLTGGKLNVYSVGWSFSIPPIANMLTIKNVVD